MYSVSTCMAPPTSYVEQAPRFFLSSCCLTLVIHVRSLQLHIYSLGFKSSPYLSHKLLRLPFSSSHLSLLSDRDSLCCVRMQGYTTTLGSGGSCQMLLPSAFYSSLMSRKHEFFYLSKCTHQNPQHLESSLLKSLTLAHYAPGSSQSILQVLHTPLRASLPEEVGTLAPQDIFFV